MKKSAIRLFLSAALLGVLTLTGSARTWTDAKDTSKTFDGELVKVDGDKVHVRLDSGKTIVFKTEKLSADDQAFVKKEAAKLADAKAKEEKQATAAAPGKLAAELKGKLVRQSDGKFVPMAFEAGKEPQFFIVYFSAKW